MPRAAFYLLFVASGFAGLIYESIWTRYLGLFLGHAVKPSVAADDSFLGGVAAASFGQSVAAAGDVNGDGYADLAVGIRNYSAGTSQQGRVSIYLGGASGPSSSPTVFMNGGVAVDNSVVKVFGSYGRDVWGPADYHTQLGWAFHYVYQAGLSYIFLRDLETAIHVIRGQH